MFHSLQYIPLSLNKKYVEGVLPIKIVCHKNVLKLKHYLCVCSVFGVANYSCFLQHLQRIDDKLFLE